MGWNVMIGSWALLAIGCNRKEHHTAAWSNDVCSTRWSGLYLYFSLILYSGRNWQHVKISSPINANVVTRVSKCVPIQGLHPSEDDVHKGQVTFTVKLRYEGWTLFWGKERREQMEPDVLILFLLFYFFIFGMRWDELFSWVEIGVKGPWRWDWSSRRAVTGLWILPRMRLLNWDTTS